MIKNFIKEIEKSYYWDARVLSLECNFFGDEVRLVFEGEKKHITYYFEACYKVEIEQVVEYPKDKPIRELTTAQIPYFLQNIELEEVKIREKTFMEFTINMYPIELMIVCSKFSII